MFKSIRHGMYGYRFAEGANQPLYQLYSVGYDRVTDPEYSWHGLHRQDGPLYLFQYTVSGHGRVDIAGTSHQVGSNQALLVEIPGDHRYYMPADTTYWEFIYVLFRPFHLQQLWQDMLEQVGPTPVIPMDSPVIHAINNLYNEASSNRIHDVYRASALVYHFFMELYRFSCLPSYSEHEWHPAVQESIEFMQKNYHLAIGLDQIAAHAGLSKYHYTRLFTKTTGRTPLQHLTRTRLEKAVELIRSSTWSMEEIAHRIGFTSGSYFTKVFKLHVGCSPSEFRQGQAVLPVHRMTFT
ncbi:AraC family transcriptional regulator [Paenibacillus daejeonensis]|uniref:AraC family transcriptional regulator n=1 Tax=Paenibacillus daejeonensis TaxID=135193 RepID=UPI0003796C78|nr:AraC family transcriptional regulator [Paenibacillus daejeonensis]